MIPRYLVSFDTGKLPRKTCDVLVVGSGVAGLSAALKLGGLGKVILATKSELQASTTRFAQGGIAAVLYDDDSIESHLEDTLRTGVGLSDPETTRVLVTEGPERVRELLDVYGAKFDKSGSELRRAREGGHSAARVVHARGDATGSEVEFVLRNALSDMRSVEIWEHVFLVDLLVSEGRCIGALALDTSGYIRLAIFAGVVVLATGGMGQLFSVTTNPPICTGDGLAMAFRAGARLSDLEFIQFHPTALHLPEEPKFLVSEAIRGEGARLLDARGHRIMKGVHPLEDLAPRDVVVDRMMEVMRESGMDHLYLDLTSIPAERIKERFPSIYRHCMEAGLDITRHPIPISPAAHYMSGGVVTNLWGETDLPGLYACGEVACTGVHGANRLASNSLLEGLVFSHRIAQRVRENWDEISRSSNEMSLSYSRRTSGPDYRVDLLMRSLKENMMDNLGMIRSGEEMDLADEFLRDNAPVLEAEYLSQDGMELQNMMIAAELITGAARMRKESRGCHRRSDFPSPDNANWRKHIDIELVEGEPRFFLREVS